MKKLYVIQHIEHEPLGIWEEELKRWHARYEYVEVWKGAALPTPQSTLAAIVLGGPMSANDGKRYPFLSAELDYLRLLIQEDVNVLGVCLGAQLLAKACGASITTGRRPEIGYTNVTLTLAGTEDRLLRGFPMTLPVFQWHSEGFELPPGAECLASSNEYPCQAFHLKHAWGFQFHLEVTPVLVDQFALAYAEFLEAGSGLNRQKFAEQATLKGQVVTLYGRQIIRRFWDSVTEV